MICEDLGVLGYAEALDIQRARHAEVLAGRAPDTVFLLEHTPVITVGRHGGAENLLMPEAELTRRGVTLARAERGGNATCHFPGQLVAYFVWKLDHRPGGVRRFFHDMEASAIRAAAAFDVAASRRDGYPGVWTVPNGETDARKLCSVGAAVKHWVSYHGLALNVGPDLSLFDCITPCGIQGVRMTSLSREAGREISIQEAKDALVHALRSLDAPHA
ncbi:MAG: lipoyl(octanoyl) transferase LipB [Desulfovibrionaceae bacterium]